MSVTKRTRYVDTSNPALGVDCPRCGLLTARFTEYCLNCGYSIWPSAESASAAFRAWRAADPARRTARAYDTELPPEPAGPFDYLAQAHELGIHVSPPSRYPILICIGLFLLSLAAIPFSATVRWVAGIAGLIVFLVGVGGWVTVEDVRMFPGQPPRGRHSGSEH